MANGLQLLSKLERLGNDSVVLTRSLHKALQQKLLATAGNKNSGDELGMEIRRLREEKRKRQIVYTFKY